MTTPLGSRPHPVIAAVMKLVVSRGLPETTGPSDEPAKASPVLKALMRRRAPVPIRDEHLTGPEGDRLRVRIYDPKRPGVRPVLVHAHGGGFRVGSPEECDHHLSALAHEVGLVVVSVDYRMIPDHPYPAALDDTICAVEWIADNSVRLRVDPARMAFTGGSAGGNLALALGLALPKHLPQPRLLLLQEPWCDLSAPSAPPKSCAAFYALFEESHRVCRDEYAAGIPADDPRISPGLSSDLGSLPPTVVLVGDLDLLLPTHVALVERLRKEGVPSTLHVFPGLIHGTAGFTRLRAAREYELASIAHLRSELVVPFLEEHRQ